jgi:hypothetical protein
VSASHVVLPLTIRSYDTPPPLDGLSEVHTWRDLSGRVCAHGYVGAGARWMRWPGVATFRFDERGHIEAIPETGGNEAQILDLCRRSVEPIVRQALGDETLHASAVRTDAGIVAFCGERETGKSTIAYSFTTRGFAQYADDNVVMHVEGDAVHALDLPFGVRLRPETARHYGFAVTTPAPLHDVVPLTLRESGDVPTTPLASIFVLGRTPGGGPEVERLAPSAAFTAILAHSHCFDPIDREGRRRLLQHYLTVASAVPVFNLRFQSGLDRLNELLDTIEAVVGELRPVTCR